MPAKYCSSRSTFNPSDLCSTGWTVESNSNGRHARLVYRSRWQNSTTGDVYVYGELTPDRGRPLNSEEAEGLARGLSDLLDVERWKVGERKFGFRLVRRGYKVQ